jgi:hypothetical protein
LVSLSLSRLIPPPEYPPSTDPTLTDLAIPAVALAGARLDDDDEKSRAASSVVFARFGGGLRGPFRVLLVSLGRASGEDRLRGGRVIEVDRGAVEEVEATEEGRGGECEEVEVQGAGLAEEDARG